MERGRVQDNKENKAREARFREAKAEQDRLLREAKAEKAAQERRSERLEAEAEKNKERLVVMEAQLNEKLGSLKELFGVMQQVAGDARTRFDASLTSVQYPDRVVFLEDLAKKIGSSKGDVFLGATYLEDSLAISRAIRAIGAKTRKDMVALTVGPALREFGDEMGPAAEGIVGVVQWLRGIQKPGAQDFAYRYRLKYGYNPGVHAAIGYSAGQVIEAAVRLAGRLDKNAVRIQLKKMTFHSLFGEYKVDETGRQVGKRNFLLQWQDDHRYLVDPPDVAERKLIYPRN